MKAEYLAAIERQRSWLDYSRSAAGRKMWAGLPANASWTADAKTGERIPASKDTPQTRAYERELYEQSLASKDIYYVGSEFCRLIDSARKTLPDDVNFDRIWMPTMSGWLYAETPIILPPMSVDTFNKSKDGPKRRIQISLSGWGWVTNANGVSFCGFQTGAVDTDTGEVIQQQGPEFFPLTYFTLADGQNLRDRVAVFEKNTSEQKDYISYTDEDLWQHEVRWIYTAFLMFDQRLLASRKHRVDRAERRRAEKAGREVVEDINVITLRRYLDSAAERPEGQSDEDWYNVRFEVSGHWRQQYYPSTDTHKPKWILPYEKGPKDAPFQEKKKRVFAAVR